LEWNVSPRVHTGHSGGGEIEVFIQLRQTRSKDFHESIPENGKPKEKKSVGDAIIKREFFKALRTVAGRTHSAAFVGQK